MTIPKLKVGKEYYQPSGGVVHKIRSINIVRGFTYITATARNKDKTEPHSIYTYHSSVLNGYVEYTPSVVHECWVIWFKMIDNTLTCTVEKTETTKESWESKYPRWEFLKCEKITYTETIEE